MTINTAPFTPDDAATPRVNEVIETGITVPADAVSRETDELSDADLDALVPSRPLTDGEMRELLWKVRDLYSMARELRAMASPENFKEMTKNLPAPLRMMLGL